MNWYKMASLVKHYTNFSKSPLQWHSWDNPPYTVLIMMKPEKNRAQLTIFVSDVDHKTIKDADARFFVNLGEDFVVDEDHSIKMNFTLDLKLSFNPGHGWSDELVGSVEIPQKYAPEFKREFSESSMSLWGTLDIKFNEFPLAAPEILRRKWKPWK